jgi:hypothetical protein
MTGLACQPPAPKYLAPDHQTHSDPSPNHDDEDRVGSHTRSKPTFGQCRAIGIVVYGHDAAQ